MVSRLEGPLGEEWAALCEAAAAQPADGSGGGGAAGGPVTLPAIPSMRSASGPTTSTPGTWPAPADMAGAGGRAQGCIRQRSGHGLRWCAWGVCRGSVWGHGRGQAHFH